MMILLEVLTTLSKGQFRHILQKNKFTQVVFSALLGIMPGCMGAYAVVSLYTHGTVGFGALIAAYIATTGDEAFIMMSMIPKEASLIILFLLFLGILTGSIIVLLTKNKEPEKINIGHIEIHHEDEKSLNFKPIAIFNQLKNITLHRAIFVFILISVIILLLTGNLGHSHKHISSSSKPETCGHIHHENDSYLNINSDTIHKHTEEHEHETIHAEEHHDHSEHDTSTEEHHDHSEHAAGSIFNWESGTFFIVILIGLIIFIMANDHFLKEHLWGHVIKKHFLKLFLWTFGTLIALYFLTNFLEIENIVKSNLYIVLILALLIGIIPVSGPHIVFISLYASGIIPVGILLANSIVQEGHGALPLIAESRKSFIKAKVLKIIIGLLVGLVSMLVM